MNTTAGRRRRPAESHRDRRDIALFTEITGDRNPIHYDEDLAAASRFGGRRRPGRRDLGSAQRARRGAAARPGQRLPGGRLALPGAGAPRRRDHRRRPQSPPSARTSRSRPWPPQVTNQAGIDGSRRHRRRLAGPGRGRRQQRCTAPPHTSLPEPPASSTGREQDEHHHREPPHQRGGHRDAVRDARRRQGPARDREVPVPRHEHVARRDPQPVAATPASTARMQEMEHKHVTDVDSDHPAVLVGQDEAPTPVEYLLHAHRCLPDRRASPTSPPRAASSSPRSARPSRATSTCSASSGSPTAASATATSRSR